MNQIIKKDKDNLEKILKETRKSSIPIYLARWNERDLLNDFHTMKWKEWNRKIQ